MMMLKRIEEILDSDLDLLEKYRTLYEQYLNNVDDCYLNFKKIVEYSDKIDIFNDDDLDKNIKTAVANVGLRYYSWIKETVNVLTKKNNCPEQFYQELYNAVFASELLGLDSYGYGIILFIICNQITNLPYYQANNLVKMSNEEFVNELIEMQDKVNKAFYMIDDRLDSFTEQASQLYDIAITLDGRERAVAFWAAIIAKLKRGADDEEN